MAGLAWVGREAGLSIIGRDRYAVRVADISCDSPPATDRAAFLTEVRYLGNLPETVQAVDPSLAARLATAFETHPWVAAVEGVTVGPDHAIRVDLRFRVPVLAVSLTGDELPRAVDAAGVLLPPTAPTVGLATMVPALPPPGVPAGKPWPNSDVKRGAELAAEFRATRVEKMPQYWRVTKPDGTVLRVGW